MRFLLLVALVLLPLRAHAGLRVVATVPDLGAIAREVGGAHVTVSTLALSSQDPHFVDAKPNLALDLSRADALFLLGLEMEVGWLPTLLTGARNTKVQPGATGYVDCSQFVAPLEVPTQKVDRTMGDVHSGGNPHYLYDPRNAAPVARGMATRMGQLDPANRVAYEAGAAAFVRRLDAARVGWEQALASLRGREVLTYHKSMIYLANWLGFTVPMTIEPKPGIPPAPAHVAAVLGAVQTRKIGLILSEEYYPATTAQLIADKSGARLVRVPGGSNFIASESYVAHVDVVVKKLVGGL